MNLYSDLLDISCGVPQGSILGPLLYLCYVNDMSLSVQCKLLLYADDSILIVTDKILQNVSNRLSKELENCYEWLVDNKLSLHLGKTECIVFCSKRKLKYVKDFSITCKNHTIKAQTSVKYLGTTLDQCLTGESIVNSIVAKANARLKFLYRQANFLNIPSKKTLCSALVLCHLEYASSAWFSGLSNTLKNKLQIIQNKCIRFIRSMGPREHIGLNEIEIAGLLSINYRMQQLRLNTTFKIFNRIAPIYLMENFVRTSHRYSTRFNNNNTFIIQDKSGMNSKTFYAQAIEDWNKLPPNIKSITNKDEFKLSIKKHLHTLARQEEASDFVFY